MTHDLYDWQVQLHTSHQHAFAHLLSESGLSLLPLLLQLTQF